MSLSTATPLMITDAGFVFWAPLATAEPTHAALASTYDLDVWSASWINLGATKEGPTFRYEMTVEPVTVAELLDPVRFVTTGRSGSFTFALANYTLQNLKRCFNGGTVATVSGAGVTLSSSYVPPAPGSEIRAMIGFESLDHTYRLIMYQTINSGAVESSFAKGADYATLACTFNFEVPSSGIPWKAYGAGTARLGV